MVLETLTTPDPVLRTPALPVDHLTTDVRSLVRDMIETAAACTDPDAVGLAAPQVGVSLRVFVWRARVGRPWEAIVNPTIETSGPLDRHGEGCLSIPGLERPKPRAFVARMRGWDPMGGSAREVQHQAFGFEARVFQHETDHLDGVLFDRSEATMRYAARDVVRHPDRIGAWWLEWPARRRRFWRELLFAPGQGWLRWGYSVRTAPHGYLEDPWAYTYAVAPPARRAEAAVRFWAEWLANRDGTRADVPWTWTPLFDELRDDDRRRALWER